MGIHICSLGLSALPFLLLLTLRIFLLRYGSFPWLWFCHILLCSAHSVCDLFEFTNWMGICYLALWWGQIREHVKGLRSVPNVCWGFFYVHAAFLSPFPLLPSTIIFTDFFFYAPISHYSFFPHHSFIHQHSHPCIYSSISRAICPLSVYHPFVHLAIHLGNQSAVLLVG